MFLQYAVWGCWLPVAQIYFQGTPPSGLGITGTQMGFLSALVPLMSLLLSPFFGQLADRVVNTEKVLFGLHLLSSVALFLLWKQTTFVGVLVCLAFHAAMYSPTAPLCNSLVMAHVGDAKKDFSNVRVGGTVGWMVAGWILVGLRGVGLLNTPNDFFLLASGISLTLAFWCLMLPKTPPVREARDKSAISKAFGLFKQRDFMMLMIISLCVSIMFEFFYLFTAGYMSAPTEATLRAALPESYFGAGGYGLGLNPNRVAMIMSFAQFSEIFLMLLLPWFLKNLGYKWTIFLGILAWAIRFAIYVYFPSLPMTMVSIGLHGACVALFLVAGSLYVQEVAPKDIRASAQALYLVVTFGVGRILGAILAGRVQDFYKEPIGATIPGEAAGAIPLSISVPGNSALKELVNWQQIFVVPTAIALACLVVFPFVFKGQSETKTDAI